MKKFTTNEEVKGHMEKISLLYKDKESLKKEARKHFPSLDLMLKTAEEKLAVLGIPSEGLVFDNWGRLEIASNEIVSFPTQELRKIQEFSNDPIQKQFWELILSDFENHIEEIKEFFGEVRFAFNVGTNLNVSHFNLFGEEDSLVGNASKSDDLGFSFYEIACALGSKVNNSFWSNENSQKKTKDEFERSDTQEQDPIHFVSRSFYYPKEIILLQCFSTELKLIKEEFSSNFYREDISEEILNAFEEGTLDIPEIA